MRTGKTLSVLLVLACGIAMCAALLYAVKEHPLLGPLVATALSKTPAAVFFIQSVTVDSLRDTYRNASADLATSTTARSREALRILIVPGHDTNYGGAEYGSVKERDVVVEIATHLSAFLSQNPTYEVMIARDTEAWHPTLAEYFSREREAILSFRATQQELMRSMVSKGLILPTADQVYHNTAPTETAVQLYGINKWTSENGYDVVLHLHINDYAGRRGEGIHSGFSLYIPDRQFSNGPASKAVGEAIARNLNLFFATSTLSVEQRGVLEDQELIAVGSNNSADAASILIEYGYITEPQFRGSVRPLAVVEYAYRTFVALEAFFGSPVVDADGAAALPHDFTRAVPGEGYLLQLALRAEGAYPPRGKTLSACPLSGTIGPCTKQALAAWQKEHDIVETGLGAETRKALSAIGTPR